MGLKIVEEGKTTYVQVSYKDLNKAPIIPTALRYRVDDLDTNAALVAWTAIAVPASSNIITIASTVNHFQVSTKSLETRVVTVEATFTGSVMVPKEIRYQITNLKYYTP